MKFTDIVREELGNQVNSYITELLSKNNNKPESALQEVQREIKQLPIGSSHRTFLEHISKYLDAGIFYEHLDKLADILREGLTRQDFIIMANNIKTAPAQHKQALYDFAVKLCRSQNPRFDEEKFKKVALGETEGSKIEDPYPDGKMPKRVGYTLPKDPEIAKKMKEKMKKEGDDMDNVEASKQSYPSGYFTNPDESDEDREEGEKMKAAARKAVKNRFPK